MRTLSTLQALPDHAWLRLIEVARLTGISRQGVDYAIKSRLLPSTQRAGLYTWVRKAAALDYQAHNKRTGRSGRNLRPLKKVCKYCKQGFTGIKRSRYCSSRCYEVWRQRNRARQYNGVGKRTAVPRAPKK